MDPGQVREAKVHRPIWQNALFLAYSNWLALRAYPTHKLSDKKMGETVYLSAYREKEGDK